MRLEFGSGWVRHAGGMLKAAYPVLDARQIENQIVVLYDYMAFPKDEPSRNLYAYKGDGSLCWRAEDIGQGRTDAYTNIMSEHPLVVGNFSSFTCTLDLISGRVLSKVFTK